MKIEEFVKKLDKNTLILILLKIINEFPIIRYQLIKIINEENEL